MGRILVLGASGFVGGHLTRALLAQGHVVRAMARHPRRLTDLGIAGCEVVPGDISDSSSLQRAVESVRAVYVAIHTLSPQVSGARTRFMDIEKQGIQHVVTACRLHGVRRVVYVTSLGIAPDAPSEWLRERWQTEQLLLNSGLDATVIRPGAIVGIGGRGFDTIASQAKRRIAITVGGTRPKMRTIALDDLVAYLVAVLDEPRSYGRWFDVGNDDVLSMNKMIDGVADVLHRPHPVKLQIPPALLAVLAPVFERMTRVPRGALKGFVDSLKTDGIGDPKPMRAIVPRPLLSFREAAERALIPTTLLQNR